MEIILRLYLLPYNSLRPVVCYDERPCFLIGDTVQGIEMKSSSPAKENYAYSKHGSCSILAAIEPKTGQRLAHVRRRRTKKEFAIFMQNLAKTYPNADKIVIVLDNLNTHTPNSFYEVFDAQTAENLAQRFDFVYTPKSASWLNMIERGGPSHRIFSTFKAVPKSKNTSNQSAYKRSDAIFQRTNG